MIGATNSNSFVRHEDSQRRERSGSIQRKHLNIHAAAEELGFVLRHEFVVGDDGHAPDLRTRAISWQALDLPGRS
jgi:hypothetical protein